MAKAILVRLNYTSSFHPKQKRKGHEKTGKPLAASNKQIHRSIEAAANVFTCKRGRQMEPPDLKFKEGGRRGSAEGGLS